MQRRCVVVSWSERRESSVSLLWLYVTPRAPPFTARIPPPKPCRAHTHAHHTTGTHNTRMHTGTHFNLQTLHEKAHFYCNSTLDSAPTNSLSLTHTHYLNVQLHIDTIQAWPSLLCDVTLLSQYCCLFHTLELLKCQIQSLPVCVILCVNVCWAVSETGDRLIYKCLQWQRNERLN